MGVDTRKKVEFCMVFTKLCPTSHGLLVELIKIKTNKSFFISEGKKFGNSTLQPVTKVDFRTTESMTTMTEFSRVTLDIPSSLI